MVNESIWDLAAERDKLVSKTALGGKDACRGYSAAT